MYVDSSKTYVGIVEENVDPKKLGRCRVRVIDIFDDIPVDDIPWATPWKDLNGNGVNIPEKGKIVTVIFDEGNIYKPEFIYSEHYNVNLESKLQKLDNDDYLSMKSLIFDHKTQIYVNDTEGLKIDHKFNNMNIKEKTINLNLKDNTSLLNLGDEIAEQQSILGNHWMDWFDLFVDNLLGNKGGPYIDSRGLKVSISPSFVAVLEMYKTLRDPVFLSKHVHIVDNNQVKTVRLTERENNNQLGDLWSKSDSENNLTTLDSSGNFEPSDKSIDDNLPDDPTYVAPPTDGSGDETFALDVDTNPSLTSPQSNLEIEKMIRFLKSKNYKVYEEVAVLNIVGMRNPKKDDGTVTNKFDDKLFVFFKNEKQNWVLIKYDITVVPGYDKGSTRIGTDRAILQLGQYVDQYQVGLHQNRSDHRCLKFATSVVHRNDNNNKYNYTSSTERGSFGINIHRSGNPQGNSVYNWSEGCQVFKVFSAHGQFMNLCDKQIKVNGKKTFTYTLIKQSEFDSFN
jgi:hypothetical protein